MTARRISARTLRRAIGCVLLAAVVTGVTGLLAPRGWFGRLDGVLTDLAFPRGTPDPSVVVVGIDDRALQEVDPDWPWSRDVDARLLNRLADAGAEVVVLDLVLSARSEQDPALAAAMQRVPTVLAATARRSVSSAGRPDRLSALTVPNATLVDAAAGVGHAQVAADVADGVVRAVPVVAELPGGEVAPSLALAALAARNGSGDRPIVRSPSGVQMGDRYVPTDDRYRLRISWPAGLPVTASGPGPYVSAADVVSRRADPAALRGKVVFVGVTDPTLGDNQSTPVGKRSTDPGVMVQAATYHTLASRQFVSGPHLATTLLWVAALSLLVAFAVQFLPLALATAATVALTVAAVVVPVLQAGSGSLVHSVYLPFAVLVTAAGSAGLRYVADTRLQRRVAGLFSRYVPPQVAAELVRDGRVDELAEGRRVQVGILFCDLRGFTPLASGLEPAEINRLLSLYYEYASQRVLAEEGTIIQYTGDEVFAIWGAPLDVGDHAGRALRCALALQADLAELDRRLTDEGLPVVRFGVGVHAGTVAAVHAGSSLRRQYTVVGHDVIIAARLCSDADAGEVVASDTAVARSSVAPLGVRYTPVLKGVDDEVVAMQFRPGPSPS